MLTNFWLKSVRFLLISLAFLQGQSILPAQPKKIVAATQESLSLSSNFPDSSDLGELRKMVGQRITNKLKGILKTINDNPDLPENKELQALFDEYKFEEFKVRPIPPHYTHLMIGKVPSDKICCINRALFKTLNDHQKEFAQAFKTFKVQVPKNVKLKRLTTAIVLRIKINKLWYKDVTLQGNQTILKECDVKPEHFEKYQSGEWEPHISLSIISAVLKHEGEGSKEAKAERVKEFVRKFLEKSYAFKTRKTIVVKPIKDAIDEALQEVEKIRDVTGSFGILDLTAMQLTKKVEPRVITTFQFDGTSWYAEPKIAELKEKAEVVPAQPKVQPAKLAKPKEHMEAAANEAAEFIAAAPADVAKEIRDEFLKRYKHVPNIRQYLDGLVEAMRKSQAAKPAVRLVQPSGERKRVAESKPKEKPVQSIIPKTPQDEIAILDLILHDVLIGSKNLVAKYRTQLSNLQKSSFLKLIGERQTRAAALKKAQEEGITLTDRQLSAQIRSYATDLEDRMVKYDDAVASNKNEDIKYQTRKLQELIAGLRERLTAEQKMRASKPAQCIPAARLPSAQAERKKEATATIEKIPIIFKPIKGSAYFAFSNAYDGAAGADQMLPKGIRDYDKHTGLLLHIDNEYWMTSDEYYNAQKKKNPQFEALKAQIMKKAVLEKFKQHDELRELLLSTDNRPLINASEHPYWGLGKDRNGPNHLGKILMQVRDELRKETQ